MPARLIAFLLVTNICLGFSYASSETTTAASATQIAEKYGPETRYAIFRNGKRIGTHSVKFEKLEDSLSVTVESDIKVTILKIPVFRFNYKATELWKGNELKSVAAITREDGQSNTVTYEASESGKKMAYASNHWHAGVLSTQSVFNTITGNISQVSLARIGVDVLNIQSSKVPTTHYRYSGDIEADVWYDDEGLWAKLQFKGEDASVISYERACTNCK